MDVVDELLEEKLHVVKEHQRRRVVRRVTCRCRDCGVRTTLRSLPAPYERSKVTCEWLAWLVHQKFSLLTPLDRIRRDLVERRVPIAMSTLVSFIERAADLLSGIDGLHWKQLLASSWMATDGTGLKVIIPQLPVAHNGYVELYRNEEVAVFQYEPLQGRQHRYRQARAVPPVLAVEGGAFLGAIYGEEEKAQKLGLTGDALRDHRQRFIRPLRRTSNAGLTPSSPLCCLPSR